MKKIFYSWQSDNKPVHNKIKRALGIVAKNLSKKVEDADRPEVDSDTQGTFGSEEILTTIFSKIDACSIFVADVTPVADINDKLVPNPNVMTELGYALNAKGPFTRLYIYCSDEEKSEARMPFDIRGKNLHRFKLSDKPSEVAKHLEPIIAGMLKGATGGGSVKFSIKYNRGGWANWSGAPASGSGFMYNLEIDNFEGQLDYVENAYIEARDAQGQPWQTTYFRFAGLEAGQKLRVEEKEVIERQLFMTDAPGQNQRLLPDIDQDEVTLVLKMRSNEDLQKIKIPPARLKNFF